MPAPGDVQSEALEEPWTPDMLNSRVGVADRCVGRLDQRFLAILGLPRPARFRRVRERSKRLADLAT